MILRVRSPAATALATCEMSRSWPVRSAAIPLTESARSFQEPTSPGTCAWPPSLPSVPISRATLVISCANSDSWSSMSLTAALSPAISPGNATSAERRGMRCDRSPRVSAPSTRFSSAIGASRVRIISFTEFAAIDQPPREDPLKSTFAIGHSPRSAAALSRCSSLTRNWLRSASSLNTVATSLAMPPPENTRRRRKLPSRSSRSPITRRVSIASSVISGRESGSADGMSGGFDDMTASAPGQRLPRESRSNRSSVASTAASLRCRIASLASIWDT